MKMKMSNMKSSTSPSRSKLFLLFLPFLPLSFFLFLSSTPKKQGVEIIKRVQNDHIFAEKKEPRWLEIITKGLEKNKMKIGLVNVDVEKVLGLKGEIVNVRFDHVNKNLLKWEDLFPEWIDEDQKWSSPTCPSVPMPIFDDYWGLDVAVVSSPCGETSNNSSYYKGVRDVFRLQVNLVAANLAVNNNIKHVVFLGLCEPMLEIFRCDDLIWNEDDVWIYKPNLRKLREKIAMPVGSCMLAPPYYEQDKEYRNELSPQTTFRKIPTIREAYVTLLHSSENYVCGAIVLAQSIIQTNSTKDLILLADDSISAHSLAGLRAAGWKVKRIARVRSPRAKKGAYNEWNYSKLRLWQLTEYDKLIFIDADLIVLKNMDTFFNYPQISAVGNDRSIFNSGVMLVEPSQCMFEKLMEKRYEIASYNGGDQGFLNEVFAWWHRWPSTLNRLKIFSSKNVKHEVSKSAVAIHYLGLKPWMCYRDYDCNWDMVERQVFASDMAHRKWWFFHDSMDEGLQGYCALTKHMDLRIKKWRKIAQNASLNDGHWKIKVKDPRQYILE